MRKRAWVALALLTGAACAVATPQTDSSVDGPGDAAASSSGGDDSATPSYGDGSSSTPDTGATDTDAGGGGGTDSGTKKDSAIQDTGSSGSQCASPSTVANCDASCGSSSHTACTANGCYNGYICNTSIHKCTAPGTCP